MSSLPSAAFSGGPSSNTLLGALSPADLAELSAHLQPTYLRLGEVVCEPGCRQIHAYFPTSAIISLLNLLANGASAEIAVVGFDGVVGVGLFMGGGSMATRAVVQSEGWAYRLNGAQLITEFARGAAFQQLLLRYTQQLITQLGQTVICNRHHSIDQQLCRWLLSSLDRLSGPVLRMTQELIANMLGVRREGVTAAAGRLQDAGLIRYRRGVIVVLDRAGLEARCCDCYSAVKLESHRIMAFPAPPQVPAVPRYANIGGRPATERPVPAGRLRIPFTRNASIISR